MAQLALRLQIETQRTLAFGSISGTYAGIGTALINPARKLYFLNTTDVALTFSDDGINDKFTLPSGGMIILDEALNHEGDYTAAGTRFYVKGSPTMGSVYLTSWYGAS